MSCYTLTYYHVLLLFATLYLFLKAKRHALSNPANTFACAKRILGRPTTSSSSPSSSHRAAELQEVASRYVDNELVEFGAGGNAAELRRLGHQVNDTAIILGQEA